MLKVDLHCNLPHFRNVSNTSATATPDPLNITFLTKQLLTFISLLQRCFPHMITYKISKSKIQSSHCLLLQLSDAITAKWVPMCLILIIKETKLHYPTICAWCRFSVKCALCSIHCAVCSVQCTVYSTQCAVWWNNDYATVEITVRIYCTWNKVTLLVFNYYWW